MWSETTAPRPSARAQFDRTAANYLSSPTHARGWDLNALVEAAAPRGTELLLDLATGPGHVVVAFSTFVAKAVGIDIAEEMLRIAQARKLPRSVFVQGDAERLPFAAARFDLLTCRFAAHHMRDVHNVLREVSRVLRPQGCALIADTVSAEGRAVARILNRAEKLRDVIYERAGHVNSAGR